MRRAGIRNLIAVKTENPDLVFLLAPEGSLEDGDVGGKQWGRAGNQQRTLEATETKKKEDIKK